MGKNDDDFATTPFRMPPRVMARPKSDDRPNPGKSYKKMTACRNGECEGDIIKETDVSYPNSSGRMGGPPPSPHYEYRAFCNVCAIVYDVTILERSLAKPAP